MKRILSLLPSTTEIIVAVRAQDQLVGRTHECDYPLTISHIPVVTSARIHPGMASVDIDTLVREQLDDSGSLYQLDLELVRELRPDVVLTQQLCTVCAVGFETVRGAMQSLPDPPEVINIEPHNLNEVFESFSQIAELAGSRSAGERAIEQLLSRLWVPGNRKDSTAPTVLFLEWLIPPFSAGHWIPELVEAAGAIPVLHSKGSHSVQLDWNRIREQQFDILVISCCGFDVRRTMDDVRQCEDLNDLLSARPELRVIVFDGNHYFSRPGPRLIESAELLHAAIEGLSKHEYSASIPDPFVELLRTDLS